MLKVEPHLVNFPAPRYRGMYVVTRQAKSKEGLPMLMRTDPFRELDRLAERVWGTAAHPV